MTPIYPTGIAAPVGKKVPRKKTVLFINEEENLIIQRIISELGRFGVENQSRAIRAALHEWDENHPSK